MGENGNKGGHCIHYISKHRSQKDFAEILFKDVGLDSFNLLDPTTVFQTTPSHPVCPHDNPPGSPDRQVSL